MSEPVLVDAGARRRIAEDLSSTLFVEAAAGTGKTSVLVERIVALLRTGELDPKKDARYFSTWITADDERLPVLIAARTSYGDVRIELVRYAAAR